MSRLRRLLQTRRGQVVAAAVVVVLIAATAGFALLGGGDDKPATRSTTSSSTSTAAKPRGVIAPLTGLRDVTSGSARRPALTIKVENTDHANPQIGLEQADVIYEEVVEGGITRLLAIYHSQVPETVGPVRSVRKTDRGVVTPIGGIFVYSGGADYAVSAMRTAPVTLVDETRAGDAMFRDSSRERPHNLFALPAQLFAFDGTPVPPPPLFTYRVGHAPVVGGLRVNHLNVGFRAGFAVSYAWNSKTGTWTRTVDDPDDAATSTATPRNVVVMFVDYEGGAGAFGAEANLTGEGDAVIFTAGHRVNGRWLRPDPAKPARFVDAAGAEIRLTAGQTWVELAPIGTPVTSR